MASIQSQLRLNDGMSAVLRQVTAALDMCLASYEELQAVSGRAMDISNITAARVGLSEANAIIDEMAGALQEVTNQQNSVNQTIQQGVGVADDLLGQIKQMAGAYLSLQGLGKVVSLSDRVTSTQARLSLIVDDGGSVGALEADIFASAMRSRSAYLDTASAIASMSANAGNAFSGNGEVIAFMEQINKQFVIGGATAQGQSAAMLQLTQAMASGALRGEELNSIIENAPGIARAIESYMGVAEGSIKQYAEAGAVTAEVVKNALFSVADETNAMFAQMPMTWEQLWTGMSSTAIFVLQPLLSYINNLANDPRAQGLANGLLGALNALVLVAVPLIGFLVNGATLVAENWGLIAPVIFGVAAALLFYNAALGVNTVLTMINGIQKLFAAAADYSAAKAALAHSAGLTVEAADTHKATIAQTGFNAALLACPLTRIIVIIIAVIAVIYMLVAAINHVTGSAVSATGIIGGVFAVLGAHLINTFVIPTWNYFAAIANFFGNVFQNPVAAVNVLFYDMAETVIGYILNMARAIENVINKIPGVEIDITSGLDAFKDKLAADAQQIKDESGWVEYVKTRDYIDYYNAAGAGYQWGENVEQKIGGAFNFDPKSITETINPNGDLLNSVGGIGGLDGMGGTLTDIANNTGRAAESLKQSDENLAFLRDVAEREAVSRFTTAEIRVEMVNNNAISSNMDLDGVVNLLEAKVTQSLLSCAEGVHI